MQEKVKNLGNTSENEEWGAGNSEGGVPLDRAPIIIVQLTFLSGISLCALP